jgi:uncharacterized protein YggE
MNMKKEAIWIGVIIVAVIIAGYFFYVSGPVISATGNSEITAKPDMISVYVISQARNESSSAAQQKVIDISDKFVSELEALGISEDDIELSNYNVYEDFDYSSNERKSLGFIASQSITVKLTEFNKTSQVISAATTAGALVSGINYELSIAKQNEYKAQALKEAGADARVKAESLASGFGRNLGKLVSVQSQDFNYYPYPLYAKADIATVSENAGAESAIRSISPSDLTVSASVSATYSMTRF